jgi:hypothetical protein
MQINIFLLIKALKITARVIEDFEKMRIFLLNGVRANPLFFAEVYFKLNFSSPSPSPPLFSTLCLMTASNEVFLKFNKK